MLTSPRAVVVVGTALLLAGCAPSGSLAADPDRPDYPLDAYLGQIQEAAQESFDLELVRIEDLTAECMAGQGFEYLPVPQARAVVHPLDGIEHAWHTREFAELYGYGLTTIDWSGGAPDVENPNDAIVAGMSEAEEAEYLTALYGEAVASESGDEWFGAGGCMGAAQAEVWSNESGGRAATAVIEMSEEVTGFVQQEPEVIAALDRWQACMADAGYPGLEDIWGANNLVTEAFHAVGAEAWAEVDWEDEAAVAAVDDVAAERLAAEVTPVELETAVADWDCRAETGYAEAEYEATMRLQEEFVAEHRAELEALVLDAG